MVYVNKDLKSIHFVMTNYSNEKIYAVKSLFIDNEMIVEGIQRDKKLKMNMHSFVKMCASSEKLEVSKKKLW